MGVTKGLRSLLMPMLSVMSIVGAFFFDLIKIFNRLEIISSNEIYRNVLMIEVFNRNLIEMYRFDLLCKLTN